MGFRFSYPALASFAVSRSKSSKYWPSVINPAVNASKASKPTVTCGLPSRLSFKTPSSVKVKSRVLGSAFFGGRHIPFKASLEDSRMSS